jgi:hypothetical protein
MQKGDRVFDVRWTALGLGVVHTAGPNQSTIRWDNYREHGIPQYEHVPNEHLAMDDGV